MLSFIPEMRNCISVVSDVTTKYVDKKKKIKMTLGFSRIRSGYRYCVVSDVMEIK